MSGWKDKEMRIVDFEYAIYIFTCLETKLCLHENLNFANFDRPRSCSWTIFFESIKV